ncbi:MAG: site-2 protease family protein [Acidimicrobiia bacterium]
MRPTIRLGRIAGIEVGVHWSLLVIGVVLVGSLAGGELPALSPHAHGSYLAAAVLAVLLFFASILAHELAHSIVARRQGQTVDGITLWLLGGVSKLGSESANAGDEFRVAIAGPATTLALAAGFGALAVAFDAVVAHGTLLPTVAVWLAVVNLILGVFNLLPGAPLDGGRVLAAMLWKRNGDRRRSQISAARAGRVVGAILVAVSLALIVSGYDFFVTALVGLFVLAASRAEESSARLLRTLDDRRVGELMRPIARSAPEWTTVAAFGPVAEPTLLVAWDGTPSALLPPGAVFAVPPEAREHVQLRALGVPLAGLTRVPTSASATAVVAGGLPALVDDPDGNAVGVFGIDELNIAARHDPVLARSHR